MKKLLNAKLNNSILKIDYTENGIDSFKEIETVKTSLLNGTPEDNYNSCIYIFEKFGFNHVASVAITKVLSENNVCILFFLNNKQ